MTPEHLIQKQRQDTTARALRASVEREPGYNAARQGQAPSTKQNTHALPTQTSEWRLGDPLSAILS